MAQTRVSPTLLEAVPLSVSILLPLTFALTYIWSVSLGHVEPDFPYISATGTYPPESCLFGQLLNISAVLLIVTIWLRQKTIEAYRRIYTSPKQIVKMGRISTYFGYSAAFGISLVGNFQATNCIAVHSVGASLAFIVGNVYLWMQAYLSLWTEPELNSRCVTCIRVMCGFTATSMNILTVVFTIMDQRNNHGMSPWTDEPSWSYHSMWVYHIVATSSEWVLAFSFCVCLLTMVPEFRRLSMEAPQIELEQEQRQMRIENNSPEPSHTHRLESTKVSQLDNCRGKRISRANNSNREEAASALERTTNMGKLVVMTTCTHNWSMLK